jgi:hypothetical protein
MKASDFSWRKMKMFTTALSSLLSPTITRWKWPNPEWTETSARKRRSTCYGFDKFRPFAYLFKCQKTAFSTFFVRQIEIRPFEVPPFYFFLANRLDLLPTPPFCTPFIALFTANLRQFRLPLINVLSFPSYFRFRKKSNFTSNFEWCKMHFAGSPTSDNYQWNWKTRRTQLYKKWQFSILCITVNFLFADTWP